MTSFFIPKGTTGKLIKAERNKDVEILPWSTRKPLTFLNTLPIPRGDTLASKLSQEGFLLFGGERGDNQNAAYVLAINRSDIRMI